MGQSTAAVQSENAGDRDFNRGKKTRSGSGNGQAGFSREKAQESQKSRRTYTGNFFVTKLVGCSHGDERKP